tara:strand:+ start:459 stop:1478 length:1020 start_codon:yes stop_codon:yes gene_type:complete
VALAEFELIRQYFNTASLTFPRPGIVLGPGDDCALLAVPAGSHLAMSMDTLNEGVHFPAGADAADLAQRCLRVNLSDLAAMGAEPVGFTLALSLPNVSEDWLQGFNRGLSQCASQYQCSLLGGDTTRGPLTITIQVHGLVPAGQALRRNGARVGDGIYVTGVLGDAALALPYLTHRPGFDLSALNPADRETLQAAFYRPPARTAAGAALRGLASAAIDVSDGVASDLLHILDASANGDAMLGAVLDGGNVPVSQAFARLVASPDRLAMALGGGDDYELCVTVPPAREAQARAALQALGLQFTRIGEVVAGSGIMVRDGSGVVQPLRLNGYRHFGMDDNE